MYSPVACFDNSNIDYNASRIWGLTVRMWFICRNGSKGSCFWGYERIWGLTVRMWFICRNGSKGSCFLGLWLWGRCFSSSPIRHSHICGTCGVIYTQSGRVLWKVGTIFPTNLSSFLSLAEGSVYVCKLGHKLGSTFSHIKFEPLVIPLDR